MFWSFYCVDLIILYMIHYFVHKMNVVLAKYIKSLKNLLSKAWGRANMKEFLYKKYKQKRENINNWISIFCEIWDWPKCWHSSGTVLQVILLPFSNTQMSLDKVLRNTMFVVQYTMYSDYIIIFTDKAVRVFCLRLLKTLLITYIRYFESYQNDKKNLIYFLMNRYRQIILIFNFQSKDNPC
jgi:hypothetical protein